MQWALLLPVVSSFQPVVSVFNVVGRQDMYLAAVGCGIAAYVVALVVLRPDADLTAFPQAMLVGRYGVHDRGLPARPASPARRRGS